MKILLDECVPRRFGRYLSGHEFKTVPEMGWAGTKNGRLLALAQEDFDVFLTVDSNLPFQQNLHDFNITIVIVPAPSNDINDLLPFVPALLAQLPAIQPGRAVVVKIG